MRTRLVVHPQIKTDNDDPIYIGLVTSTRNGVLVEFLEQIDEENDDEEILPYFSHIDGFSLFHILPEGLEHTDGVGTCDLDIPQMDIDINKDYVLKVIGVDII